MLEEPVSSGSTCGMVCVVLSVSVKWFGDYEGNTIRRGERSPQGKGLRDMLFGTIIPPWNLAPRCSRKIQRAHTQYACQHAWEHSSHNSPQACTP